MNVHILWFSDIGLTLLIFHDPKEKPEIPGKAVQHPRGNRAASLEPLVQSLEVELEGRRLRNPRHRESGGAGAVGALQARLLLKLHQVKRRAMKATQPLRISTIPPEERGERVQTPILRERQKV